MSQQQSSIDILYDICMERLKAQIGHINGIDTKIGILFGLSNGILIALIGFVTQLGAPTPNVALYIVIIFTIGSLLAYIVSLILLFFSYKIGKWDYRPNMKDLHGICESQKYRCYPEIVKEWIADECVTAFEYNKPRIKNKANKAAKALYSLVFQVIFLAIATIAYLIN